MSDYRIKLLSEYYQQAIELDSIDFAAYSDNELTQVVEYMKEVVYSIKSLEKRDRK